MLAITSRETTNRVAELTKDKGSIADIEHHLDGDFPENRRLGKARIELELTKLAIDRPKDVLSVILTNL